ncbi:MAG: VCBS repeat-containing protein [Acidobacteriota bacterium]
MLFLPSCKARESKAGSTQLQQPIFTPAPGSPFPTGKRPSSIAVGDLNNDGKPDFVTGNKESKDVTISLGNGRGDFKPASGSPVKIRATPQFIAMGDLNKDGNLDLAIAPHDGGYDVTILLGDGKVAFRTAANSPLVPLKATSPHNHGLALGDVNGDGNLDIITANAGMNRDKADNSVSVLLGNGRGAFRLASGSPFKLGRMPADLAIGDLNRDDKQDLVTGNEGSRDLSVMLSNGSGGLQPAPGSPLQLQAYASFVAIGDVNNDGNLDILTTHDDSSLLTIFLGAGKGYFKAPPSSPFDLESRAWNIIIADINNDRMADLVARSENNSVMVLLGNGSGAFLSAPGSPFTVGTDPISVAVGDVNADGKPDILTANSESNNVTVLLGK